MGPVTTLGPRALTLFGQPDVETLLHALTSRAGHLTWRDLTRLAAPLLDEAEAGDPVARTIVAEQATRLGAYARAAVARVALPAPFRMCLMGGVFRHASRLFSDAVVSGVPGAVRVLSTLEPACGAIILALHQLELGADRHELLATLPASALFVT